MPGLYDGRHLHTPSNLSPMSTTLCHHQAVVTPFLHKLDVMTGSLAEYWNGWQRRWLIASKSDFWCPLLEAFVITTHCAIISITRSLQTWTNYHPSNMLENRTGGWGRFLCLPANSGHSLPEFTKHEEPPHIIHFKTLSISSMTLFELFQGFLIISIWRNLPPPRLRRFVKSWQ